MQNRGTQTFCLAVGHYDQDEHQSISFCIQRDGAGPDRLDRLAISVNVTTRKLTSCRQEGNEEIASSVCAARWPAAAPPSLLVPVSWFVLKEIYESRNCNRQQMCLHCRWHESIIYTWPWSRPITAIISLLTRHSTECSLYHFFSSPWCRVNGDKIFYYENGCTHLRLKSETRMHLKLAN